MPKVAELLEGAEEDLIARKVGGRSDVVGIFPNDDSTVRLAGALLIEQNGEWLISRRYLPEEG